MSACIGRCRPRRQGGRRAAPSASVRPYLDSLPLFGQFQITNLKKRPRILLSVPSMHDRSNRHFKFPSPSRVQCVFTEPQYFLDVNSLFLGDAGGVSADDSKQPKSCRCGGVWICLYLLVSPLPSHLVVIFSLVNEVRPFLQYYLFPFYLTLSLSLRFCRAVANLTKSRILESKLRPTIARSEGRVIMP